MEGITSSAHRELPRAHSAHEARDELPDHDAPREPPEQIERVIVGHRQHEVRQPPEIRSDVGGAVGEPPCAHARRQPHRHHQRAEQPHRRHAEDADIADVSAGQHRQQHRRADNAISRAVIDGRYVERQVPQQQMRRERAGPDDDDVVHDLHRRDLEQPQVRLHRQEVERRQEVEAPDQESPESEAMASGFAKAYSGSRA